VKAYLISTSSGPLVVLTSCDSIDSPRSLEIARAKGYDKFIAHELPLESVKAKYGVHFEAVCKEPHENDALRVLDYEGKRIYRNFSYEEFGKPQYYELSYDGHECLWSCYGHAEIDYRPGDIDRQQSSEAILVG